ncbi:MAG: hypothetical protein HY541_02930, partial [Deltaproteobacteria bacterium]|nr:hypothetical protein [Deltaproteobacteria bacterium]
MSWSDQIFSQEVPLEGTSAEENSLPSNSQPAEPAQPVELAQPAPAPEPTPPAIPAEQANPTPPSAAPAETSPEETGSVPTTPPTEVSPEEATPVLPPTVPSEVPMEQAVPVEPVEPAQPVSPSASPEPLAPPLPIEVNVGQKIIVGLDGIGFFVSDDTIISIEEMPPNRVAVTGLKGGNAQILFWKEGVLSVREVTVMIPPIFSGGATTLQFRGNRPFFIYDFANFSSFSEDKFYQSPSYNHTLVANSPLGKGRLSSSTIFRHAPGEAESLERALVTYQDSSRHFWFGETSGNVSRLGIFSSASVFGSLLRFDPKTPLFGGFSQEINVFGGFEPPNNLLQTEIENQVYGANYSLTRYIPGKIRPDFANASFFVYQPGENETFKLGGVAEANYHLGDFFSLGGGV